MKNYYVPYSNQSVPYTDLAVERRRADTTVNGVEYSVLSSDFGSWERVEITSKEGEKSIGRPMGVYYTLNTGAMAMLDENEVLDAANTVADRLCRLCDEVNIIPERILVLGLGNRHLTPDSIGPRCADVVKPTLHIKNYDEDMFEALECSEIAVIAPGVSAESGMESSDVAKGVCQTIAPDVVIAIDSLASNSETRLGSTIQICNTGIFPGSGIGNHRSGINQSTLKTPVIAIGVPTVIDAAVFRGNGRRTNEPMMVAPKDIDAIAENASKIIGYAINQAFGITTV